MSNLAQPDDIDALVTTVRKLVTHGDTQTIPTSGEKLVLTPALRVDHTPPAPEPVIAEAVLPQHVDRAPEQDESPDTAPVVTNTSLPAEPDAAITAPVAAKDDTPDNPASDDAALRALIVKIVHEELAGEMGEKITQNVRKMVRREINRLMAAQQLD